MTLKVSNQSSKEMVAQKAYEMAYEYEGAYGACSQCVSLAVMRALNMENPAVFKAAYGFAGGMGDLGKTCGALVGGIMMISLVHGRDLERLTTMPEEEANRCNQMVRDLHDRFVQEYGSSDCSDVLFKLFGRRFNQLDPNDFEEYLRLGGHVDKCTGVAGNVARWTVTLLLAK